MIRMPKAERLMYVAQGLNALTEVLISDLILEDSSQAPGARRSMRQSTTYEWRKPTNKQRGAPLCE